MVSESNLFEKDVDINWLNKWMKSRILILFLQKKMNESHILRICQPNVKCDGCGNRITNERWSCLTCRNFDFCESCHIENQVNKFHYKGIHEFKDISNKIDMNGKSVADIDQVLNDFQIRMQPFKGTVEAPYFKLKIKHTLRTNLQYAGYIRMDTLKTYFESLNHANISNCYKSKNLLDLLPPTQKEAEILFNFLVSYSLSIVSKDNEISLLNKESCQCKQNLRLPLMLRKIDPYSQTKSIWMQEIEKYFEHFESIESMKQTITSIEKSFDKLSSDVWHEEKKEL